MNNVKFVHGNTAESANGSVGKILRRAAMPAKNLAAEFSRITAQIHLPLFYAVFLFEPSFSKARTAPESTVRYGY